MASAVLVLDNGPENRVTPALIASLDADLDRAERDESLRAVILTGGSGKFFSNGLDLSLLRGSTYVPSVLTGFVDLVLRLLRFPKLTVAAMNGHAFGAGFFLALACDYRVCRADRGWFCIPLAQLGLDVGPELIDMLWKKMPPSAVRDTILLARRWSGPEALRHGVVDASVQGGPAAVLAEAHRIADRVAGDDVPRLPGLPTLKERLFARF